jgi:hypothetical protein
MTYPFITRFKKKIERDLLIEKSGKEDVSASSIMEELAGLWIKDKVKVSGKKIHDIYSENRHKLDKSK